MAEYKQVDLQIGTEAQFESKKETLSVGTIVGITDPIHKSELDSSLQTSIDSIANKLDKPSGNPTEDSVVKVSSTGTVSWEKVSKLYRHEITPTTGALFKLIVINNSSTKITKFTDLLGANYVSMYVGTPACTPAIALGIIYGGSNNTDIVGIKVKCYIDFETTSYIEYLDSNITSESDTFTEL